MGVTSIEGGCAFVTATNLTDPKKWIITLDPDCEFQIEATALKTGSQDDFCVFGTGSFDPPNVVTFDHSDSQNDISNVQFVFCKVV